MLAALTMAAAMAVSVEPARLNLTSPPPLARVMVTGVPSETPPRLWVSAGEVGSLKPLGGGRWEARFRPPASGSPGWAMVAAIDDASGEAGAAAVELWARTELPVETEPGAHLVVATGGHRVTARADSSGHARVVTWVGPLVERAKVTAEDAAGNTTVEEVALDLPRAPCLWLVAGATRERVYAFSVARALPHLQASGAEVDVDAREGIAAGTVRGAAAEVTITATLGPCGDSRLCAGDERAELVLGAVSAPPIDAVARVVAPSRFADPRWELGASLGPRISESFTGAGLSLEFRRRVRASRIHLGLDAGAVYASGAVAGDADVRLGGAVLRVVGELRLSVGARVALHFTLEVGGALVGERRAPASSAAPYTAFDGGPSLGGGVGLLARMGPGLLTISVGGAWTPLFGLGRANLDGGMLSVGYRYGRF